MIDSIGEIKQGLKTAKNVFCANSHVREGAKNVFCTKKKKTAFIKNAVGANCMMNAIRLERYSDLLISIEFLLAMRMTECFGLKGVNIAPIVRSGICRSTVRSTWILKFSNLTLIISDL